MKINHPEIEQKKKEEIEKTKEYEQRELDPKNIRMINEYKTRMDKIKNK